jgi:N-terminal helicase PWI domain
VHLCAARWHPAPAHIQQMQNLGELARFWRPTVVGRPICVLVLQEIRRDAFWLQRRVSSAFGSMDAAEAQQLAEKIFRTLEVRVVIACILHVLCTAFCAMSGDASRRQLRCR